jgi:hypothetical protein
MSETSGGTGGVRQRPPGRLEPPLVVRRPGGRQRRADRLEQPVAHLVAGLVGDHKRGVDQPRQERQRVGGRIIEANGLRRLEGEAANEQGQAPEQLLLLSREQAVTPADRGPQGAMSGRGIGAALGWQVQPPPQPRQDRLGREDLRRRGGQLEREARLADPGRAGDGHESHVRTQEQVARLGQLALAPDQPGARSRIRWPLQSDPRLAHGPSPGGRQAYHVGPARRRAGRRRPV